MARSTGPANGTPNPTRTKRPSSKKPNGADNGVSADDVARRAYEIYESRGRANGEDLDHWLEAERQLRQGSEKPKRGRKAASTNS